MGLPRNLRQELELIEVAPFEDGSPRWRLYDPAANKFYDLGWLEVEILQELRSNLDPELNSAGLAKIVADRAHVLCSSQQIDEFIEFLEEHDLFWIEGERALEHRKRLRTPRWKTMLQGIWRQYLFFRVPILNPDRLLDRIMPYVGWAFRARAWWVIGWIALFAIYLTSRQADYFFNTFVGYFTPQGLVYFGLAVILAKVLHEFGHALAARRYGCSVRAMGVAVLVFWPILYTDTTDAWRLRSRRKRAMIGVAGMVVELGLAAVCLLLWNFVPDSFLRNILFMMSTTTWIMTLAINLNPLMRFDGYYILSDLTGVENLQERANAMGRWRLREWLFGYGRKSPDPRHPWLAYFAYAMWVYRLFVFFGITYIVYTYFFKALGVVLAAAQVFRLLVVPIGREVMNWWAWRGDASPLSLRRSGIALGIAVLLVLLPVDRKLELPGYWQAQSVVTLYAPVPGRLALLPDEDTVLVEAGSELIRIESPDLQFQYDQAGHDLRASRYQLERTSFGAGLAQERLSLQAKLQGALETQANLQAQLDNANLSAPFSGRIADRQPDLRVGDWVQKGDKLLTLVDDAAGEVVAFVGESELRAIPAGATGLFYPEGGTRPPQRVELVQVDDFAVDALAHPYVASTYGGGLDVRDGKDGELIPQRATYRIELAAPTPVKDRVLRGQLVLDAEGRSLALVFWRQILGIWRRESGI
ncbi:MAG: HlyD family efflux transporter periplasmic adaptor subunit [Halieaceae bacterium]|nr:HlyD family efflux transporter periplasmic adaptor subunit [Halieaceae bacterium]